ncbi:MAG: glycosyltransferase family 39 protein [bacterium]|nr:glycosyltransferase family 39 protein [bacterium]
MKYAAMVWIGLVGILWVVYAPWREGAVVRDVLQSDASEYYAASVNLLSNGVYATSFGWPSEPDNYRPPLFPLVALGVYRVMGVKPLAVLVVNSVLFFLSVLLVPVLTKVVVGEGGEGAGRWSVWFAAVCPVWVVTSLMYMPDALFTFLMGLFYLFWMMMVREMSIGRCLGAGCALGLATLTKPVVLYLPVVLIGILAWYAVRRRSVSLGVRYGLVLLGTYAMVLTPWYVRNYRVYGRLSFVSYEGQSLLDFTAANVVRRVFGCDLVTARTVLHERLKDRYELGALEARARATLPRLVETNVAWVGAVVKERYWPRRGEREVVRSLAELSAAQKKLFVAVLKSHPLAYVIDSLRGMVNIVFGPPWQECLRMTMPGVDALKLAVNCIRGRWREVMGIGWKRAVIGVGLAGWMTFFAAMIGVSAAAGVVILVKRGEYVSALSCVLILGYFLAVAGPNGEARYRAPLLPLVFPLAGVAWDEVVMRIRGVRGGISEGERR